MKTILASGLFALLVLSSGVGLADGPSGTRVAKTSLDARSSAESRALGDARHVIGLMEGSAHGIAALLSKARRTDDARAVACVNESLSQADVLTRRAKERLQSLHDATIHGDSEEQGRLLGLIQDDRALQRDVTKTAFACVGVVTVQRGKDVVVVNVTIDHSLPPEPRD